MMIRNLNDLYSQLPPLVLEQIIDYYQTQILRKIDMIENLKFLIEALIVFNNNNQTNKYDISIYKKIKKDFKKRKNK